MQNTAADRITYLEGGMAGLLLSGQADHILFGTGHAVKCAKSGGQAFNCITIYDDKNGFARISAVLRDGRPYVPAKSDKL